MKVQHIEQLIKELPNDLGTYHLLHYQLKEVKSFLLNPQFVPTKVSPQDMAKEFEGSAPLVMLVCENVGHSFLA